jgi:hypothetical protein
MTFLAGRDFTRWEEILKTERKMTQSTCKRTKTNKAASVAIGVIPLILDQEKLVALRKLLLNQRYYTTTR